MKKIILKFVLLNIDIFNFFYLFNKDIKFTFLSNKKFVIKFYGLFKNFNPGLQINFLLFLFFLQVTSILIYFQLFKNLDYKKKKLFISKLNNLNVNNLSRGLIALRSQSIIINTSIFKKKLDHES